MKLKKILNIVIIFALSCMFFSTATYSNCDYAWWDIAWSLDSCLSWSDLVNPWDGKIDWGVKDQVVRWTNALASLLGLLAVWAIVYGWLLMTLSIWDDEKVKKWKDVVKWALLWFLWVICASALVRLVVELMFSFTS